MIDYKPILARNLKLWQLEGVTGQPYHCLRIWKEDLSHLEHYQYMYGIVGHILSVPHLPNTTSIIHW